MSNLARSPRQYSGVTIGPIENRFATLCLVSLDKLDPVIVTGRDPGGASFVKKRHPYLID
jgi:hypothetical protein